MAKILILGGGFAALAAAEVLAKEIGEKDEIVLVSKNDQFIFYPGFVPMVFGDFKPQEIRFDLMPLLRERRIRFVQGEFVDLDTKNKAVHIRSRDVEEIISFDFLLIALGRTLAVKEIPGYFEYAHHILGFGPALRLKEAISNFSSGSIVVGLCPDSSLPIPVCEAALALAQKFQKKITGGEVTVTAVFPATLEKALAGAGLFRDLESEFERKGIRLVSDFPVISVREDAIHSAFGSAINYDLLMLVPPFLGQKALASLRPFANDEGYIQVDSRLRVAGFEGIYAAGDIISLPGPRFGYMAIRQGKVAAENIISRLRGREAVSEYANELEWIVGERFTHPVFFHYGFWDDTLSDFDENAFFGMAKLIRERYGSVKPPDAEKAGSALGH